MDWSSDLRALRSELEPLREELEKQASIEEAERQERLAQVKSLFKSLQIEEALNEMNRILLDRRGEVAVYAPWQEEEDVGEEGEDLIEENEEVEEDTHMASAVLTWEESGVREIAVDLGVDTESMRKQVYVLVNGSGVRLEQDAVRQALIRAFREELGL